MRMYDIIQNKRDGGVMSDEEIQFFVDGVTSGDIPDYQITALLMAIYFQGMNEHETSALTLAMAKSGDMIDLSGIKGVTVDKHSTGGVGDKTTLIIAPIVSALGGKLAKMSGRGLGHTGGTVDKFESFAGFNTELPPEQFINQVNDIGICVVGQSGNLAPCDKKLYALRDVTATVNSVPLIASSIMSKKIAAGSSSIVLDVKTGSGAFMKTLEDSKLLAKKMVDIGYSVGRKTAALITNMDIPLGHAIGNALEVKEAIETLKGNGPKDLTEVCVALASNMTMLVTDKSIEECEKMVLGAIADGSALKKLHDMVAAQGGDANMVDHPELLPLSNHIENVLAPCDGYIKHMDAEKIGIASVILGAGREKKGEAIDYSAGIILKAKTGDLVKKGDVIAEFHTNLPEKMKSAEELFLSAIEYSDEAIDAPVLVYDIISKPSK
ncbi:MAG: pyrimidine-nucleoside phosphorylase [Clostridia bacterium]|nr:pyrimidine-nucleoside phosphorylase [Clostridia bacterium]